MQRMGMLEGSEPNKSAWYALYTHHQHEKLVAHALSNKGVETFLPLYRAVRQWSDRTKVLTLPLFPCYVFLRGGLARRADVLATPGIHGFVTFGEVPAPIPDAEIAAVRRAIETQHGIEPHPFLRCGDWVRVKWGPLEGLEGILLRKKGLSRLVLSVELLQRSAAVEVDAMAVEPVARQKALKPLHPLVSPAPEPLGQLPGSFPRVFPVPKVAGAS